MFTVQKIRKNVSKLFIFFSEFSQRFSPEIRIFLDAKLHNDYSAALYFV
jgi:hypothetical protein